MHELAVTENILKIALEHAARAQAKRISAVYLVIGQMSSIVDDSVQFYWDLISAGTPAEGAQLHFRRLPIQMRCLTCEETFQPTGEDFACPRCGGQQVRVVSGDEFYLESIEVE